MSVIIVMTLCLRLFGCLGNVLVVGSPATWVVWRRGGGGPIPDWNGMHSPLESAKDNNPLKRYAPNREHHPTITPLSTTWLT